MNKSKALADAIRRQLATAIPQDMNMGLQPGLQQGLQPRPQPRPKRRGPPEHAAAIGTPMPGPTFSSRNRRK